MDYAARELGIDAWEFRRRNFIAPEKFPYKTASQVRYDVGDFGLVLDRLAQEAALEHFAARRAASAKQGLLRGLGLCCYIESILGNPTETSRVVFQADGSVDLYVGTQSGGQGHETVYAQYLADQTGLPVEQINVIQGDSDLIPTGGGTGGSRSATVQNSATLALVTVMTQAYKLFLAEHHEADPSDVSFDDEVFRIAGSNVVFSWSDAAQLAREAGQSALLDITQSATLDDLSFPNGAHLAEVEVDPQTGQSQVVRYVVVDDFGYLLNPMLVEGQVHGGVVQGLGQAMMEHVVYDDNGQLLTASFMDYGMPRASDVPMFDFNSVVVPSTANPIGMKGCGEAGTIGSMAAVANAVMDALASKGVTRADMPFTPQRVWSMLQNAG
jgi:carbon-monoxide dehydrogenase large subunit